MAVPGGSFSFLMSDDNTKVLQNPEIRALDQEKATLKIGDRIPIATGSFQAGGGVECGGISPLVNTQFQYLDVGVNIRHYTAHSLESRGNPENGLGGFFGHGCSKYRWNQSTHNWTAPH